MALNVLKAILPERLPTQTQLLANYPNSFNPETWIAFQPSQDAEVTVSQNWGMVISGRYVATDEAAYWDRKMDNGEALASGTNFYQLQAGDYTETRKMVILK